MENQNSGYGQAMLSAATAGTLGRTFVVGSTTEANINFLNSFIVPDRDGTARLHATITSALAACVADYGDVIYLAQDFTTAPTAASPRNLSLPSPTPIDLAKPVLAVAMIPIAS